MLYYSAFRCYDACILLTVLVNKTNGAIYKTSTLKKINL
jgi:hypothetical protein